MENSWHTTILLVSTSLSVCQFADRVDGLQKIARQEGFKGLYRGLLPSLFGVSHGALQFTVYEMLKNRRANRNPGTVAVGFSCRNVRDLADSGRIQQTSCRYPRHQRSWQQS